MARCLRNLRTCDVSGAKWYAWLRKACRIFRYLWCKGYRLQVYTPCQHSLCHMNICLCLSLLYITCCLRHICGLHRDRSALVHQSVLSSRMGLRVGGSPCSG